MTEVWTGGDEIGEEPLLSGADEENVENGEHMDGGETMETTEEAVQGENEIDTQENVTNDAEEEEEGE